MNELNIKDLSKEQLINLQEQIQKQLKESEVPKDEIDYENGWVPIAKDMICAVRTSGVYHGYMDFMYSLGLYRSTKEQMEALIRKMKIHHRLQKWADMCDNKINWKDTNQPKWYASADHEEEAITIEYEFDINEGGIHFTDEYILKSAIADIGEQNLLENYFMEV